MEGARRERDVVGRDVVEGAVGDRQVRSVRDGTRRCHLLLRHRLQDPPQAHGLRTLLPRLLLPLSPFLDIWLIMSSEGIYGNSCS